MVLIANVPHDHGERGASSWIVIMSMRMYGKRCGVEMPLLEKELSSALWSLYCRDDPGWGEALGVSRMVHYSGHI